MLQSIRDRSQGWIAGTIIAVICFTFAIWGIHNYFDGSNATKAIAKVNGQKITQQTFDNAYQRYRRQMQMQGKGVPTDQAVVAQLRQQILQQLISRIVLSKAALKQGFRVSQEQVNAAISQIPVFQENGKFSPARYQQVLSVMMYQSDEFMQTIHDALLDSQINQGMLSSAVVLPTEVQSAMALHGEQRDLGYLLVPASRFKGSVNVTPQQVKAYYTANKQSYMLPEKVSIEYVQLSAKDMMTKVKVDDKALQQYYQDNQNMFAQPAQRKVAHILVKLTDNATTDQTLKAKAKADEVYAKLQKGADFSALAKESSDDKISAKQGGDLGWITPGQLGQGFDVAMAPLNKVGQYSKPTRTKYGYDIVKLEAIKQPVQMSFEEAKPRIEKILKQQKAEELFANDSDQLANLAYENPNTLEPVAKALDLKVQSTGLFTHEGLKIGIAAKAPVVQAAFSKNAAQGNNSEPVQIDDNDVVVLRVKQHTPAAPKPLALVQDSIKQTLVEQAAMKKAQAFGQALLQKMQSGTSGQSLAKENNLQWHYIPKATRNQKGMDPAILEAAFGAGLPTEMQSAVASAMLPESEALITVSQVYPGESTVVKKSNSAALYRRQLAQAMGQLDYSIYVTDQMTKAKIKIEQAIAAP